MRPTLFISDLHLAPERPALTQAFAAFCNGPARDAAALYVLGDLFDTWAGDEQLAEPLAAQATAALAELAQGGVPVVVMRGNRDLLLADRFMRAAHARDLASMTVVDIQGTPTLLLHGDELCTDDAAYQRYRAAVHDPVRVRRFLALPYFLRRAVVAWIRRKSRSETVGKTPLMMDVNAGAVADALRANGVTMMIHGHTHRPARHELSIDGKAAVRWVLPDWRETATWLEVGANGAELRELA